MLVPNLTTLSKPRADRPTSLLQCSAASIKRPIAILDRTAPDAPPRLRIFESVLKQDPTQTHANYAEVPVALLDLLLVTALLLVSDAEEWKKMPNAHNGSGSSSGGPSVRSSAASAPASVALWRNMIPPELGAAANGALTERPLSPTTSAGGSSGGNRSSAGLSDFPDTPASAPERPFPFSSGHVPPVPPVPEWATAASAMPLSAAPSSSSSMSGRRQLPAPPTAAGVQPEQQPWLRHAPSFSSSSGSGGSRALPPHLRAVNTERPSTSDGFPSSSLGAIDYARRGSYDEAGVTPTPTQHPYALASINGRATPPPGLAPRTIPTQRPPPPAAALPLPPKLAPEKQRYIPSSNVGSSRHSATPDAVTALGVRLREAALLGDLPPGRESVFDMPPPAYDAIFASPTTTSFTSPTTAGFPSPLGGHFPGSPTSSTAGHSSSLSPTPRPDQVSFGFGYGAGPSER